MNPFRLDHLLSMVAAPVIWGIHFVVCYVLVSLVCALGWSELRLLGMPLGHAGVALASLIALILLGYTAALNIEKYRRAPSDASDADDPAPFIALNSVLLCALSTVALVWVAFPALMLPACSA